ncbi:MAG: 1-acyl-sn-glycerol-3-phosphate acyltransferase, partial [Actinobacteria bacterium]|nr:1-acyl-sn-glycerol-3-phosphate acyltransferase [Actinomycetota bacterium]
MKRLKVRPRGFPWTAPAWPGGVERPAPESRTGTDFSTDWARRYPVRLARALMVDTVGRGAVQVLAAPEVTGTDRLAGVEGPVIFAANHASHVDTPLLLTTLPDRFRHKTVVAAGADYFFDKRWKGALWAFSINAIPIERTRVSPRSTRLASRILSEGWSLLIFPEGGRSPHGWAQSHRAGAAYLALRRDCPIVPVHLEGTRRILRKGGGRLTPSTTSVTFGKPITPAPGEDPRDLAVRVEKEIAVLADERATD